jgi:hypothetical protein
MARVTGASAPHQAFNPRIVAAFLAAGVVGFLLFLVLLAYAGDLGRGDDPRAHALSGSAIGFKGIVRLVELSGGEARLARSEDDLATEDLVVLTLEARSEPDAVRSLLRQREGKATLLVLPKWRVMADPDRPGWVRSVGHEFPYRLALFTRGLAGADTNQGARRQREVAGTDFLAGFEAPAPALLQWAVGGKLTPLVTAGPGRMILSRIGRSPHYLLSDPDLLNNLAMKNPKSARAALTLLRELNSTDAQGIAFDVTLNGFGRKPSALKLAFEPPFLPLTLALVVAALLAGLHGAFRFGPEAQEARAIALGKAALVENSASLFRIARREYRAGAAFAELVREAAARETGADSALHGDEIDAYLDRLSPADGPPFTSLAEQARQAGSRSELVEAARALTIWKKDLIK